MHQDRLPLVVFPLPEGSRVRSVGDLRPNHQPTRRYDAPTMMGSRRSGSPSLYLTEHGVCYESPCSAE